MDKSNARTADLEKSIEASADSPMNDSIKERTGSSEPFDVSSVPGPGRLARWNTWIENLAGFEARGIVRVSPEERHAGSVLGYAQMAMLWFSMNVTANNLAIGLLGPLVFNLGFVDSAMMATFGSLLGSAPTAYMSIWGPRSGNRTMILARYFMGYWPAKLTALLNIILTIGYGVTACIIAGQILSAVSGGSMSIVVGIIITALITWLVTVFGMALFQTYQRWAWIPQLIVLLILAGTAGKKFDLSSQSTGGSAAITAGRLSFLSLSLSAPVAWSAGASDFYVYVSQIHTLFIRGHPSVRDLFSIKSIKGPFALIILPPLTAMVLQYPESTLKRLTFFMTLIGLWTSYTFVYIIGIGLASGITLTPSWSTAYDISSGALILEGYSGVGGFGKFCGVVVALGIIANSMGGTYSAALDCQVLGRYGKMVPRYLWVCAVVLIYFVCAIAGRKSLLDIFQNFLPLMGYWIVSFVSIVFEEHMIFRRTRGFDWSAWEDKKYLPVGAAALTAFLIGWAGAIVGMYQVWYVGPVAKLVGGIGADIGIWLGMGFTLLTFPPLRYLELRHFGR